MEDALQSAFSRCAAFFRDCELPPKIASKYKVGLFLRERAFCDTSYKQGGFLASHRFLIISSNARCLDEIAPNPWGLCILMRDSIFKIIDINQRYGLTQITLLEIPEPLMEIFCRFPANALEESFASQARETFHQCLDLPKVAELDSDDWRERISFPLGVSDEGLYFPLFEDADPEADRASHVSSALLYQGQAFGIHGCYSDARSCLEQSLAIARENDFDPLPLGYNLLALAQLHEDFGDYRAAEDVLTDAYQEFKKLPDDENREQIGLSHVALGRIIARQHPSSPQVELNCSHAKKIGTEIGDFKMVSNALTGLGVHYEHSGRYDDAIMALENALDACDQGNITNLVPTILNNLGRAYLATGDLTQACEKFDAAISATREEGPSPLSLMNILVNKAECKAAQGEARDAYLLFKEALDHERVLIAEMMDAASIQELQRFLDSRRLRLHQFISFAIDELAEVPEVISYVQRLILERKALSLDLWAILRRKSSATDVLRSRAEHLSSRLDTNNWKSLASALPEDAAFIEYFLLRRWDPRSVLERGKDPFGGEPHYIAVVLSRQSETARIVKLGSAAEIDGLITRFRMAIARDRLPVEYEPSRGFALPARTRATFELSGKDLGEKVIGPVLPYASKSRQWFICPDGDLFRLPFEALAISEGGMLMDDYEITYLSNGHELIGAMQPLSSSDKSPVVVADPNFDLTPDASSLTRSGQVFEPLPGARSEGDVIASLLGVNPLSGAAVTKEALMSLESPSILHFATHGFVVDYTSPYLQLDELQPGVVGTSDQMTISILKGENLVEVSSPMNLLREAPDSFSRLSGLGVENPLLRSGVALTGANTWLHEEQLPPGWDDGILTAEDASCLRLDGTQLVVLSACESGLGDIRKGEGVFGLRRSFAIAGAQTLIMSLWKVPDTRTRELMVCYYEFLSMGEGRSAALRKAKLVIRKQYPDPFFWAAFICQGRWQPLEQRSRIFPGPELAEQ